MGIFNFTPYLLYGATVMNKFAKIKNSPRYPL